MYTVIFFCFGTENILQFPLPERADENECERTAETIKLLCEKYDRMFSVFREDSEISLINANAGKRPVRISRDCMEFLKEAERYAEITSRAFEPLIRPLSEMFDEAFLGGRERPGLSGSVLKERTELVRRSGLFFANDGNKDCTVMLPEEGMGIDPGGIAKGFVLDRITGPERQSGVPDVLEGTVVSLGGSVAAFGSCPVLLKNPFAQDGRPMARLQLENEKAVTSGTYERFFPKEGRACSHIFDARTGRPASSGVVSVTLIGTCGAALDAFATACVVRGPQAFKDLFSQMKIEHVCVYENGEVYCSQNLQDRFELL